MAMIINGLVGEHAHGPYEYIEIHFMEKQANMHLGLIDNHFMDRG
jgi:di/tripeptidase